MEIDWFGPCAGCNLSGSGSNGFAYSARIRIDEQVCPRELLLEEAVDFVSDVFRRARAAVRKVPDPVDFEAGVSTRDNTHARVLRDMKQQELDRVPVEPLDFGLDLEVEEAALLVKRAQFVGQVRRRTDPAPSPGRVPP